MQHNILTSPLFTFTGMIAENMNVAGDSLPAVRAYLHQVGAESGVPCSLYQALSACCLGEGVSSVSSLTF